MKRGFVQVIRGICHTTGVNLSHDGRNGAKLEQDIANNIKIIGHVG